MQTFEIKDYLQNPTEEEVKKCISKINGNFELSIIYLNNNSKLLLNNLSDVQLNKLNQGMFAVLNELKTLGKSLGILKNTYVKFLCWLKRLEKLLIEIDNNKNISAVYYGEISKYENYLVKVLNYAGCITKITKEIPKSDVITNEWMKDEEDIFDIFFKKNSVRGFLIDQSKKYNLSIQYLGVDDKKEYNNRLYNFKKKLVKENKQFIIIENKIQNPLSDEVPNVNKNQCLTKDNIVNAFSSFFDNKYFEMAFKKIFSEINDNNINQLFNIGIKIFCWSKRYSKSLYYDGENIPLLIYYGEANDYESYFLRFLSLCPVDVLYISPSKIRNYILGGKIIELPNVYEIPKFPVEEVKVKVATTAYKAEKEIENTIYNEDTCIFKNQQFAHVTPITLKTTYEEIFILWNEEATVRPSFKVEENRVFVPNIFAKICGVKDGNKNNYTKEFKSLVNDKTIVYDGFPLIMNAASVTDISLNQAISRNKIVPDYLKKIPEYKYDYINDNTQNLIIEKIQELIDLKWIEYSGSNLNKIILGTLLNLDKMTLDLIQNFDFTKDNPKIIIYDNDEAMPNVMDCIYLCFLNLIGFDIVIFTPTGYKNIEKFIKKGVWETYLIGDYMYDIKLPKVKGNVVFRDKGGFFSRLFS